MTSRLLFRESGQASVELVALIPIVLATGLVAWQLVLAGHALWLAGNAARVAARAETAGRDGLAAARSALPRSLERGLELHRSGGLVRLRVRVPWILWGRPSPLTVGASAGEVLPR